MQVSKKCVCVMVILMIMIFCACGTKTAEPIILPSHEEITEIQIIDNETAKEYSYSDKEWIEPFISIILEAEPTDRKTVQDVPNVENYFKIDILCEDKTTTLFCYEEDGSFYIEQPYHGIYKTETEMDSFIVGVE